MAQFLNNHPTLFLCSVMALVGIGTLAVGIGRKNSFLFTFGIVIIVSALILAGLAGLANQPLMPHYEPIHP